MRKRSSHKKPNGEAFDVVLGKSAAVITSSAPSEKCGVSAMFSGRWVRSQEDGTGGNFGTYMKGDSRKGIEV